MRKYPDFKRLREGARPFQLHVEFSLDLGKVLREHFMEKENEVPSKGSGGSPPA